MASMVRSAVLSGYVELTLSLGVDPMLLLRSVGIGAAALAASDTWLPADAVDLLMERTAYEANCEAFGLHLAARRGLSNLGPVALVAREEPDIRSALHVALRHIALHNEALRTQLTETGSLTALRIQTAPGATLGRQSTELAVGATCRILREFLGRDWHPLSVCFTHSAPAQCGDAYRILGPSIEFDQSFDGIVCYTHDLDTANPLADPMLRPYAREYLRSLAPSGESTLERVRAIIETLLPTQQCSAATVADHLGMDRRTLHRHLTRSGETFTTLLDTTRLDLAHRYLTHQDRTLSDIAAELGFSELSAFSRWFRHHTGHSPSRIRTR
ncbi:AraC-type DNA-binding protein [Nocardia amikacinitolerans]|uniref:AraC family transcriptional regulator n=1 Tax=Nocardia amikacinitolerans TaxID=756689 RepID=UPI00082C6D05|nr:AraC family transcriptional regulator [Nocardia amikacinitolerans]MCP2316381.1 AraC-type DNA-binding protein [Nocardia amikacinitolerans]